MFVCCESHKGFVQDFASVVLTASSKHTSFPITPAYAETNTATRQIKHLVGTGQLPMMHRKFNVSSSASLHQSRAISSMVRSAQSN